MLPGTDEGLGFHQDGTVRKAGGSGNVGPSDGGRRAAAYAGSGLGYGVGYGGGGSYLDGYVPLSGIGYDHLTGRYDPARDGRRSYERRFDGFDPVRTVQDRVLSWGLGALNSAGEAALSGIVDKGRARLNFTMDWDGKFRGEGDVLLPFYDGQYTTIFTQIGARSMAVSGGEADGQDRWRGNFGLGQRWFPAAKDEEDAGDWMVGYNAFFDNDFTRSHQRGGVGVELQYDWLHLASNYYFPLSDWKGSYDFDSRLVEERPAEGWDARLNAYLPFYRNVAFTGAYTQWFGDHVGMFGASRLEKDPRVWSYGIEYTPIPLVSGFLTQRSTERGRTDTEYGLNFTYHFGMSWDDQVTHSKVAELRTVSGSKHEFVDRENRIILEYRAKNAFHIDYLGPDGARGFLFRVRNGFDEYVAGQTVRVTASGAYLAEAPNAAPANVFAHMINILNGLISVNVAHAADLSKTYVTDSQGRFWVLLDAIAPNPTIVTAYVGESSESFTLSGSGNGHIHIINSTNGGNFTSGNLYSTASLTAKVMGDDGSPAVGATVTWTVVSAQNKSPAMKNGWGSKKSGLTWGPIPEAGLNYSTLPLERITGGTTPSPYNIDHSTTTTGGNGETKQHLTDIVGQREITVQAEVNIGGTSYLATQVVSFGNGPLSVFTAPSGNLTWNAAYQECNGTPYPGGSDHTTGWSGGAYVGGGKMPTRVEYQAVSPIDTTWSYTNPNSYAQGAAFAAGWPVVTYFWTGEASGADKAFVVTVDDGSINDDINVSSNQPVACLH
jgi:hypothetical protein